MLLSLATLLACATTPPAADVGAVDLSLGLVPYEAAGRAPVEVPATKVAPALVLHNAQILTAAGEDIASGYIVLRDGRIEALGAGTPPEEIPDATLIDAKGGVVTPGLIDTHSHLGVYPSPGAKISTRGDRRSVREASRTPRGALWNSLEFLR